MMRKKIVEVSEDAAGNITQDLSDSPTRTYQWDGEGRLVSVDGTAGQACQTSWTACFVYNALGQRVEKQTGSNYSELAYDAFGNLAARHDRGTAFVFRIYYLGNRPIARHQDSKTYFMHPNHLGSTIPQGGMTDQTGATTQKTRYYPFGQLWTSGGTIRDDRFPRGSGQVASMDLRDAETGNDPTLFRMNNSRLYRWLSPDPLGGDISNPQSLNRYGYVMNNPANFVDPTGLGCENSPINNFSSECYPGAPPDYSGGGGGGWVGWGGGGLPGDGAPLPSGGVGVVQDFSPGCQYVDYAISHADCGQPGSHWPWPSDQTIFASPIGGIGGGGGGAAGGASTTGNADSFTASMNADVDLRWLNVNVVFSFGLAIDTRGCVALLESKGGGVGSGPRASGGISGSVSNAKTVQDLGGPFWYGTLAAGEGAGGYGTVFGGDSPNGRVIGGTLGGAASTPYPIPITGAGGITKTTVETLGAVPVNGATCD